MPAPTESGLPFSVEAETIGSTVAFSLSGDFDIASADIFKAALAANKAEAGGAVVIDLSAVGFMDSTGLRLLITANREAAEAGHSLTVVTGDSPAKRVLELTRMDEHIRVVRERETEDD